MFIRSIRIFITTLVSVFTLIVAALVFIDCSTDDPDDHSETTISIANATGFEGQTLEFVVSLNHTSDDTVVFNYTSQEITASNADYEAATDLINVSIFPGQTSVKVLIKVEFDNLEEGSETFKLFIINVKKATVKDDEATGTITDSNPPFFLEAKIDGALWTSKIAPTLGSEVFNNELIAFGRDDGSRMYFITGGTPWPTGSYTMVADAGELDQVTAKWSPDYLGSNPYTYKGQAGGSFTVTSVNYTTKIIEGTFSFTGKASNGTTVVITAGKFKLPIGN